jgi:hypothetical protein
MKNVKKGIMLATLIATIFSINIASSSLAIHDLKDGGGSCTYSKSKYGFTRNC